MRYLKLGIVSVVAVLLAACGGSSTTGASSSPATAATAAPGSATDSPVAATPAPAASVASEAPAGSSVVGGPSLPAILSKHADPGLEAQLPGSVSGATLSKYSLSFTELLDAGGDRASIDAFLKGIGKSESDASFAAAFDPTNAVGGGVSAFKVSGADTATLLAGIVSVEESDLGTGAKKTQATVGGKDVTVVSVGLGVNDTVWIYGRGDVVFVVQAPNESAASAFLTALP